MVVKVKVEPETNKEKIHQEFTQNYQLTLQTVEEKYKAVLAAKEEQIEVYRQKSADMMEITKLLASKPISIEATGNKFMPEASQQNVTQNIGTNTGQAQAISTGGDVNASQSMNQGEGAEEITQEQAVELLAKIEELIKAATLPSEVVEEAADYTSMAKKEAKKKEPRKSLVIGNLEGAISLLQNLSKTTDAAKELIGKLKPHVVKLATWLGVAATHFWA